MQRYIYWSHDTATQHLRTPGVSLSQALELAGNFPFKTRWERTARRID